MEQPVIQEEAAEIEVASWLDYKRVPLLERKIPQNEGAIKVMVSAVMSGNISFAQEQFFIDNSNKETAADGPVITHTLIFPVGSLTELKYKPRARVASAYAGTKNLNGIGMAVYVAYATELTGKLTAQLNNLDTQDFKILQAITTFFL